MPSVQLVLQPPQTDIGAGQKICLPSELIWQDPWRADAASVVPDISLDSKGGLSRDAGWIPQRLVAMPQRCGEGQTEQQIERACLQAKMTRQVRETPIAHGIGTEGPPSDVATEEIKVRVIHDAAADCDRRVCVVVMQPEFATRSNDLCCVRPPH